MRAPVAYDRFSLGLDHPGQRMTVVGDGNGNGDADTVADIVGVGVGDADAITAALITMDTEVVVDVPDVAVAEIVKLPDVVGVPLITPAELMASPPGSPVAVQV
jgi:hypothetical protein